MAQPALAHGRIQHQILLHLVHRSAGPAHMQLHRRTGHVQADEMRHQPHHRAVVAVGKTHIPFDLDQTAQPRDRRVPEQAPLQHAAAEPLEQRAGKALALARRQMRQTQLQVAQGDFTPRARKRPQQAPEGTSGRCLHRQRQPLEQPQKTQQQTATHHASSRGCL